ncbi:helix-turn-helix transcriptional regulator [Cupriavidus agavae]
MHAHAQGQLLWPMTGPILVEVGCHRHLLSAAIALWIPPRLPHRLRYGSGETVACLSFQPNEGILTQGRCALLNLSALTQQLIRGFRRRLNDGQLMSEEHGRRYKQLLRDELGMASEVGASLPIPVDRRLQRLVYLLSRDPSMHLTAQAWGQLVGLSERSLMRLFRQETGMSFGEWARTFRISCAAALLEQGLSVADVAHTLGYAHASTLSALFRKELGVSPTQFLARNAAMVWPRIV